MTKERDIIRARLTELLSCKHESRSPSRARGSYGHPAGPVEFCDKCGAACLWGEPTEADTEGPALSRDALRALLARLEKLEKALEGVLATPDHPMRKACKVIAAAALKEAKDA